MDVVTLVGRRFLYFHLDAMRVGPGVLTDAGNLPGNFHVRLVGLDGECLIRNLGSDPGVCGLADGCELIAEIAVEASNHVGMLTTAVPLPSVMTLPL